MNNHHRTTPNFVSFIQEEIIRNEESGSTFALGAFTPVGGLAPEEKSRLIEWGAMLIRAHLPPRTSVLELKGHGGIALLLRGQGADDAATFRDWFLAQLNKLPVYGFGPGEGWECEMFTCPRDIETIKDYVTALRAGEMPPPKVALAVRRR